MSAHVENTPKKRNTMNQFLLLILLLIAVPAWFRFRRWSSRRRRLPPGPFPLPIIGNLLQLGRNPSRSLAHLAKTYGPLMSLQLGSFYTVVVSSPETAKAVLQKHDVAFSGRVVPVAVRVHEHHNISISTIPLGEEWRKLRRICREKLFSSGRLDASEGLREERLQKLREYVGECSDAGREMDVGEAAFATMLNLMWATLFSKELTSYGSGANQELKEIVNGITRYIGVPNAGDFFPIFERSDPQGIKKKVEFYIGKMLSIIEDLIHHRLKERSSASAIDYHKKNDLLETLLDIHEGGDCDLSLKEIKHLLSDLIVAGSDTTSTTTEWALTELLLNPEKLSMAKHELKTVIGEKKQIQEADIARLPYLKAVIKEVLRCHPPSPLLPRKTEEEVEINGCRIPKHTREFINLWAITKDPNLWSDPNSFEPERFLDKNIDFKGQDFELIPFGSGRRVCPGMPLADRMLHVLVATLIHNFDWEFEVGDEGSEEHRRDVFGLSLQKAIPLKAIPHQALVLHQINKLNKV